MQLRANKFVVCVLSALLFLACEEVEKDNEIRQKLHHGWTFSRTDDSQQYDARVPGDVHSDLERSGHIKPLFENNNELDLQWIGESDWHYRCVFTPERGIPSSEKQELIFEGIDTYAKVFLNDSLILEADNMFRSWTIDVKGLLMDGANNLDVYFESPLNHHKRVGLPDSIQRPSGSENGELNVGAYTRKAPYQFGWDWGPRYITAGLWRSVTLVGRNENRIQDVCISTTDFNDELARLRVDIALKDPIQPNQLIEVYLDSTRYVIKTDSFFQNIELDHVVHNPKLWWPNGAGEAHLSELKIGMHVNKRVVDETSKTYGIRSVFLHQERDSIGQAYYFEVNGEEIFIKGANYIPQSSFPAQVSTNDHRILLQKVKNSGMNMIRIWGGGIYESDDFYALCDSLGIMVWQDFMFAGSLYPTHESFLSTVREEVTQNVKRLRSHPCLALWCGNNEIEVALNNWGWESQFNWDQSMREQLWSEYSLLFEHEIPMICRDLSPDIPYVSTSPTSNWGTPENFNKGSMHYWGVWHGREPFSSFQDNVGRFMVEYGFQSFPDTTTLSKYVSKSDLHLNSSVMKNRQKSYIGNGLIEKHILEVFDSISDFGDFVQKSQWTQTLALRTAISEHRSAKGHCMGTLFWQLNDCWPGPSWSVIQANGIEKHAFKDVSALYKPIIGLVSTDNSRVLVKVISDRRTSSSLLCKLQVKDQNDQLLLEDTASVHCPPHGVIKYFIDEAMTKSAFSDSLIKFVEIEIVENGEVIFNDRNYTDPAQRFQDGYQAQ